MPLYLGLEFDSAFVDARAQEAAQQAIHSFDQEATSTMPLPGHQLHEHLGALAARRRDWLREQLAGVPEAIPLAQHRLAVHMQEVRDALGLANEHMEDHAALRAQQAVGEVALQAQQAVAQAALRAARCRLQEKDAAVRRRQEWVPWNVLGAEFEAGQVAAEAIFQACAGGYADARPVRDARLQLNVYMHQLEGEVRAHNDTKASHQQQADEEFAHAQFVDDEDVEDAAAEPMYQQEQQQEEEGADEQEEDEEEEEEEEDEEEVEEGNGAFEPTVVVEIGETGGLGAANMAETTDLEEGEEEAEEQEPSADAAAAVTPAPTPAAAAVAVERGHEEAVVPSPAEGKPKATTTAAAQEKSTTPEEEEEAEVALASVPAATSATVKETPAAAPAPVLAAEAAAGKDEPADRRHGPTVRFALPTGA